MAPRRPPPDLSSASPNHVFDFAEYDYHWAKASDDYSCFGSFASPTMLKFVLARFPLLFLTF